MRLQTMYVDMRPVLTKWLGLFLLMVSLVSLYFSLIPDVGRALNAFQQAFHEANQSALPLAFWKACIGDQACWESLLFSWSAPPLEKALYLAGILFGVFCGFFGMWWRPEVIGMRDVRLNANRVEISRRESPHPPSGML